MIPQDIRERLVRCEAAIGPWEYNDLPKMVRSDIHSGTAEDDDRQITLRQIKEYLLEKKPRTGLIYINTDCNAPGCPCEIVDKDSGRTILVQTDLDYPGFASTFGWRTVSVQKCPSCGDVRKTIPPEAADINPLQIGRMSASICLVCEDCDTEHSVCPHDSTDGTVPCKECGVEPGEFISAAYDFLADNDGLEVQDPGYFDGDESEG